MAGEGGVKNSEKSADVPYGKAMPYGRLMPEK